MDGGELPQAFKEEGDGAGLICGQFPLPGLLENWMGGGESGLGGSLRFRENMVRITSKQGQRFPREDVVGETAGGISSDKCSASCSILGLESVFPVDCVAQG